MARLSTFQRWAIATTFATYLLIAIGGLVRASGAGLGCPDWPKCFEGWIPPTSLAELPAHIDPATFNVRKAWTEYINRLIGVVIGLLIFVTTFLAVRRHRDNPRVLWPTVAALVLVAFQGWLGGQVVAMKLKPIVVSAHLSLALVIVSLLLYATVCAFFPEGRPRGDLPDWRRHLGRATLVVICVALLQVTLGAVLRGELQLVDHLPRAEWLSTTGMIQRAHSSFAVLTAIAVLYLVWQIFGRQGAEPWLRRTALGLVLLLAGQVAGGLGMVWFDMAVALQVLHLYFGSLLLGGLTVLALLAFRLSPA